MSDINKTLIQKYLNTVSVDTGYVGNIEFDFNESTRIHVNLDKDISKCCLVVSTQDTIHDSEDAFDCLDRIDRMKAFGLFAGIKISATRRSEEELSHIDHEPFPLCR